MFFLMMTVEEGELDRGLVVVLEGPRLMEQGYLQSHPEYLQIRETVGMAKHHLDRPDHRVLVVLP